MVQWHFQTPVATTAVAGTALAVTAVTAAAITTAATASAVTAATATASAVTKAVIVTVPAVTKALVAAKTVIAVKAVAGVAAKVALVGAVGTVGGGLAIAGGVIGGVILLLLGGYVLYRWLKPKPKPQPKPQPVPVSMPVTVTKSVPKPKPKSQPGPMPIPVPVPKSVPKPKPQPVPMPLRTEVPVEPQPVGEPILRPSASGDVGQELVETFRAFRDEAIKLEAQFANAGTQDDACMDCQGLKRQVLNRCASNCIAQCQACAEEHCNQFLDQGEAPQCRACNQPMVRHLLLSIAFDLVSSLSLSLCVEAAFWS